MQNNETKHTCINCGRTENETPLIEIRFAGNTANLCSQCIPIMIHEPQKMASKLDDLNKAN